MHWSTVSSNNRSYLSHQYRCHTAQLLCSALLFLSAFLPTNFTHASTIIQLAHVGGHDGAIGRGGFRFAENLEKVSGGAMSVKVIPDGALGGIRDIWAQMQAGSVHMQVIDLSAISLLKAGRSMQVTILPYLFESQAHFRTFAESKILTEMVSDITEKTGIRYLGIVEDRSPRIISTTGKVVNSINDIEGLKIRVPGHPMFIKVFKSWGAIPTPISPAEMFVALKSGMVEAEDNGIINLADSANNQVIKSVTQIDWSRSGVAAWISESSWGQFTAQERAWVSEAIDISERDSKVVFQQRMQEAEEKLTKLGIVIQPADIDSFKAATQGFYEQFDGIWPTGTVAEIKALIN